MRDSIPLDATNVFSDAEKDLDKDKFKEFLEMIARDLNREPPQTVISILGSRKKFDDLRNHFISELPKLYDKYIAVYKERIELVDIELSKVSE